MSDAIKTIDEKVLIDFAQSVSRLLDVLGSREKDILERRFKLQEGAKKKYTLEDIGKLYEITRERVRQIEADSIKKLRQVETEHEARQPISLIHDAMLQYLKEHGGTIQEDYLVDQLMAHFKHPSVQYTSEETRRHREALSFIISQILAEHFEKITSKSDFHNVWKLKEIDWEIVSDVLGHLIDIIKKEDKPLKEDEILSLLKSKPVYPEVEKKFLDHIGHLHQEMKALDEILLSYLKISKNIKKNLFEEWGLSHWNTISPKKINDKIYLILKKAGKPLHFNEITEQINKAQFDHKTACAATVHNELILDKKYVLVGRGIYALREWGFEPGTVSQVISQVLKKRGELTKAEIVEEVKKQRIVKQATVNLALMNKDTFKKLPDGKYALVEEATPVTV